MPGGYDSVSSVARLTDSMLKDDRVKGMEYRSLFAEKDTTDKIDNRQQVWEQQRRG